MITHRLSVLSSVVYRLMGICLFVGIVGLVSYLAASVYADSTSTNLTQAINAGTLSIDIVDGSYAVVGSPAVAMGAVTFSFSCQPATGTLGTAGQKIYVTNPDAADSGWTLSIAGSSPTAVWDGAGSDYDFNEAGSSGCIDDGATTDSDGLAGRLTIDASAGTLAVGQCSSCTTSGITKGSSTSFVESSVNSITVLSGAAGSNDIGDWTLQGVTLTQDIPAEQPAASDYDISLTLTATAS